MKEIFSLCLHLLVFFTSDAEPLKLVAGDRSVVKKDGATHTISKYYVVPSDFDPNNTDVTQTSLRSSVYSKSLVSGLSNKEINVNKTRTVNDLSSSNLLSVGTINTPLNLRSGGNVKQEEVTKKSDYSTESESETKVSGSVILSLDSDDLGKLQVEPIINSNNESSKIKIDEIDINDYSDETLESENAFIAENVTDYQSSENYEDDSFDDLILTKFGIAVHETYAENLKYFWKLVKLDIDQISDDDELLATVEKLSLLLNIFTNLYEKVQSKKPIKSVIDRIIEILQIPFVAKSNQGGGDYDEECLRKCDRRSFIPQLDSNGTYLSETEGQVASDGSEIENGQRRQRSDSDDTNDLTKNSDDSDSNQITANNKLPIDIREGKVTNNLNVGKPDGFNVLSSLKMPNLNSIVHENDIQDVNSKDKLENQPITIESRTVKEVPWRIEDKTIEYFPWPVETKPTDNLPWHIEDKTNFKPFTIKQSTINDVPWNIQSTGDTTWSIENNGVPWHIEDKFGFSPVLADGLPWHIEDKIGYSPINVDGLPWHIEDKKGYSPILADGRPWQIEDKAGYSTIVADGLPWHIEDKIGYSKILSDGLPWHMENKIGYSPITKMAHSGNFLLNPNQPIKSTVQSVKQLIKRPYHIYTYVINPTEFSYAGNAYQIKSRQRNNNLGTKFYGIPPSHSGNKVIYNNPASQSSYQSQISLSKPTVDINSQPSYTRVQKKYVTKTYSLNQGVNPSTPYSQSPQEGNPYGPGSETNHKPAFVQPNTDTVDSQPDSDENREALKYPELYSVPEDVVTNIPTTPVKIFPINNVNNGPVTTSASSSTVVKPKLTQPNPYVPNDNANLVQQYSYPPLINTASAHSSVQINPHPGLIDLSAPSSINTNNPHLPVHEGQLPQQPGSYSTASAHSIFGGEIPGRPTSISSASTNVEYTNDKYGDMTPDYEETPNQPGVTSTSSAHTQYSNVPNDYDDLIPVYNGETPNQVGVISTSSAHTQYKNVPNDGQIPVYNEDKQNQPGIISTSSAHTQYSIIPNDYDDLFPVYNGETPNQPGVISTSSAHTQYKNVPNDGQIPVYNEDKQNQPGIISTSSAHTQYSIIPNDYDDLFPVYNGETPNQPDVISTSSAHTQYLNVPNDGQIPVYDGETLNQPGVISTSSVHTQYTKPNPIFGGNSNNQPGFISKLTSQTQYTNVPDPYDVPSNVNEQDQPNLISNVHQYPVYPHDVNDFDVSIPVHDVPKQPGYNLEATSHSEYIVPNTYNNPSHQEYIETDPSQIQVVPSYPEYTDETIEYIEQKPVNGGPTLNIDDNLVPYQPYGNTVDFIPNLVKHVQDNQQPELKLTPTYRLLTLQNLHKLENAIIKSLQLQGADVYTSRALINLKKILNVILILAENIEEADGSIAWYENIFYISQHSRHPLQLYVYYLIRQRWLHELLVLLERNNFSIKILQNPGLLSFLEHWEIPQNVQNFIGEDEDVDVSYTHDYNFKNQFATHTYDDVLEELPEDVEQYLTKKIIESYKSPNDGIVLSIAGVEAEPDANAIVNILQKYLQSKSLIEKQENTIIGDNKTEMLKQIIMFLRRKGYGANTIAALIQKLYASVYSAESKACDTHHTIVPKNIYDVILPVLRRSG